jgi:hypothetical protein
MGKLLITGQRDQWLAGRLHKSGEKQNDRNWLKFCEASVYVGDDTTVADVQRWLWEAVRTQMIADRAYALWQLRGCPIDGSSETDRKYLWTVSYGLRTRSRKTS